MYFQAKKYFEKQPLIYFQTPLKLIDNYLESIWFFSRIKIKIKFWLYWGMQFYVSFCECPRT